MPEKCSMGGQAVLEGIMLRAFGRQALAVRLPDGTIKQETTAIKPLSQKSALFKVPIFRGMAALYDSLSGAVACLGRSAQLVEPEAEITSRDLAFTVVIALLLGVGLFFVVPVLLIALLGRWVALSHLAVNALEGLIRVLIFVGYLVLVGLSQDVKRTFAYHGAEHKVIHCWEQDLDLTPETAEGCSRLHSRCGTSFLLLVVLLSIVLFALFAPPNLLAKIGLRLALLPLLAGLAFEVIRLSQRSNSALVRLVTAPGLALQRLTTREPDREQLEVALAAIKALVDQNEGEGYNNSDNE